MRVFILLSDFHLSHLQLCLVGSLTTHTTQVWFGGLGLVTSQLFSGFSLLLHSLRTGGVEAGEGDAGRW